MPRLRFADGVTGMPCDNALNSGKRDEKLLDGSGRIILNVRFDEGCLPEAASDSAGDVGKTDADAFKTSAVTPPAQGLSAGTPATSSTADGMTISSKRAKGADEMHHETASDEILDLAPDDVSCGCFRNERSMGGEGDIAVDADTMLSTLNRKNVFNCGVGDNTLNDSGSGDWCDGRIGHDQLLCNDTDHARAERDDKFFGGMCADNFFGARILMGSRLALVLCLLFTASSALADWTILGAAYRCKAGKSFELRATVDTSRPNDPATVRPKPDYTELKQEKSSRLICVAGRNKIEAVVHVWGPKANGECAGSGDVSIESFLVNGKPILHSDEPFNMSCPDGDPAVVSVNVQGSSVRVCRGKWDWGKGYYNVECNTQSP